MPTANKRQKKIEAPLSADQQLLSEHKVVEVLDISRATIRRRILAGTFPEPMRLGKCKRWRRAEIEALLLGHAA